MPVSDGVECWCSHFLSDTSAELDEEECELPRDRNPENICGGTWTHSVYLCERQPAAPSLNPTGAPFPLVIGELSDGRTTCSIDELMPGISSSRRRGQATEWSGMQLFTAFPPPTWDSVDATAPHSRTRTEPELRASGSELSGMDPTRPKNAQLGRRSQQEEPPSIGPP